MKERQGPKSRNWGLASAKTGASRGCCLFLLAAAAILMLLSCAREAAPTDDASARLTVSATPIGAESTEVRQEGGSLTETPEPSPPGTVEARPRQTPAPYPASTAAPTRVPPETPTTTSTPTPTRAPSPTEVPTRVLGPTPTAAPQPEGAAPAGTPAPSPKPPVADIVPREPELRVVTRLEGYWSDGTANVEVSVSPRNWQEIPFDSRREFALDCTSDGEPVAGCRQVVTLFHAAQGSPEGANFTLRVPTGNLSLELHGGEGAPEVLEVAVPRRIVGVDRLVWECFSDTSNLGSYLVEELGIGCGAWNHEEIRKWDQSAPLKVFITGPDGFAEVFRDVLGYLSPVVNQRFEWVDSQNQADIAAYIGYTEQDAVGLGAFCTSLEAFGCASTEAGLRKVLLGEIVVYNLWPDLGTAFTDFDEGHKSQFRSAMLHEAVHALGLMGHRPEVLSVMNESVHHRPELNPMDEALLRLQGNRLIAPGMTLAEIRKLIVFNDELLDPRPDASGFTPWALSYRAYRELQNAATASFSVRASSAGCPEKFGWAEYRVGNLTGLPPRFGWVSLADGGQRTLSLQTNDDVQEHWSQSAGQWSRLGQAEYANFAPGWRSDLSDPHHMMNVIFANADWGEVEVTEDGSGQISLRFDLHPVQSQEPPPAKSVEIRMVIDRETHAIVEYIMEWQLDNDGCGTYLVEAKEGRAGVEYELPEVVRQNSEFIEGCPLESLGALPAYARWYGDWYRECGLSRADDGSVRTLEFSLDHWAFVRLELYSFDDIRIDIYRDSAGGPEIVPPTASGYLLGGHGLPGEQGRLRWTHLPLGPGDYSIDAVTLNPVALGSFELSLFAQETPAPPYRFKAISAYSGRTCGLLDDGTPLCWGRRNVEGEGTQPPGGKFESLSTGQHVCALREDGTPACWDYAEEGQHTCEERGNGAIYCTRSDQPDPGSAPTRREGEDFVVIYVPIVGGYYDQAPPAGERLQSISVGWVHACGLRTDGTPVCWGSNQLGKATPPPGEKFKHISSGTNNSCGIRENGVAVCWGGTYGTSQELPGGPFVSINVGETYTCALREDGGTDCWGGNGFTVCKGMPGGFFGCNDLYGSESIAPMPPAGHTFTSFSSEAPNCALRADGSAVCWTQYESGLLPEPEGERFTSISASVNHACALRPDGAAACWGRDRHGEASPPSGENLTAPPGASIPTGLVAISSGLAQTCALDGEGDAYCWGPNWWRGRFDEKLASVTAGGIHACGLRPDGTAVCRGNNDEGISDAPEGLFTTLSAGEGHTCGLREDGTAECWGKDWHGQASPPEGETFRSISSGGVHTCGLRDDGSALCWGPYGGNFDMGQASAPEGERFISISSGGWHTCGLREDRSVTCWGTDRDGQVSAPAGEFISVSSGWDHTCALTADGGPVCWGAGSPGGENASYGQGFPPSGERFMSISSGDSHTCALRQDGTAVCWGSDEFGQSSPRR